MDIDFSKENIQPLRGGRNFMQLGTALQAQSDVEAQRLLQHQKEELEAAIRHYQGPDPLEPWFNYIQWVEQSFPKHGHEGQIDKLIKDCLQLFEKDERYFQDRRFVKLWIKYVDNLTNPTEMYQRLYNTGIGVSCTEFYRAWACYCEESGDYKKANQVYMLGVQAKAQPADELEQAHMNFQLFFAQRMLHDDSPTKRKAASALAETRMALTSLKSFKRRNITSAPVQRVGSSIKSVVPGTVKQQGNSRAPNSNIMVDVFVDDSPSTSQSALPVGELPGSTSLVQPNYNIENEKEVGIWSNAKVKMVHSNLMPPQPLPFAPYEDEEDELRLPSNHMHYCLEDLTFNVPLCVPDPVDSTKIPCYNKVQVYVDEKEYSLEEIRSRKYNLEKNIKEEIPEDDKKETNYKSLNETLAQCSALETLANCALDTEQDHLAQLMPLTVPTLQTITRVTNMHSPGEPTTLVNLDSKEVSEHASKKIDENQKENTFNSEKANLVEMGAVSDDVTNVGSNFGKNPLMEEFNRSLMSNLLGDSVTVNTKEARWELRNIFNDNAESKTYTEPSMVQPVVQQFDTEKFNIHEDRSMTMVINAKKTYELHDTQNLPENQPENAIKYNSPGPTLPQQINKTTYYDDPSSTQIFNFNIKDASTPNMSQFKKPASCTDQSNKFSVPKFALDESMMDPTEQIVGKKQESSRQTDQHATVDTQGAGLSVIMEATREYNSKSGSSSSGQSRTNVTGYMTNIDSMYNNNDPSHFNTASKRNSVSSQRLPNGQLPRSFQQKRETENKAPTSVSYHSHDHQYQKPTPPNYNAYSPQRPHSQYQQNYSYQQGFPPNQIMNTQPGFGSPNAYHSPQHPSMQGAHDVNPSVPCGFQSPNYNSQGYHSPGQPIMNPQHSFQTRQDYHYGNQAERPYPNQAQQPTAIFQSPPHQAQYPNSLYYQRSGQNMSPGPNTVYSQHNYSLQNQFSNANVYQNPPHNNAPHNANNSNYVQNQYRQTSKPLMENQPYGMTNNHPYQIYQSPQSQTSYSNFPTNNSNQEGSTENQMKHDVNKVQSKNHEYVDVDKNRTLNNSSQFKNSPHNKNANNTSLRNVRHDQPNAKVGQNSPEVGFSSQFLNFITNRNEPKDNANTPKFTNSPSISQKMHKNLYVSSPEQAQIPPSSGLSDSDSKDGMTAQTATPIQSAKVSHVIDKNKDISKRQLDFEHRLDIQCEDSRDSVSKESKISSVYSRQSDFQSDGYGMDVDSENSMESGAFKSTHSISLVETIDIPRPADISFPSVIDPFNKKIISSLLEYVKFPNKTHADGYTEVKSIPKIQLASVMNFGSMKLSFEKQLGKGNYGAVFLCQDLHSNKSVAVKYQKPSRPWEFYICQEIKARIKDPFMLPGYMDITTAFLGDNASLFVSEYSKYGSLLDVANKVRLATSKCINEYIVILLTSEMLSIVHYLHKAQIIHADIKPDNFLLMKIPTQEWRTPSLQLIDFGCGIDMSLFPKETTFRELIATEGFTCTEMREGKPWTYQTDLYCLAGTIYVILMGNYMKVANRLGQWNIDKKLPRYMKNTLWDKIFTTLLNVRDCNNLPDLMDLKRDVDSVLNEIDSLGSQLRNFANVLKSR